MSDPVLTIYRFNDNTVVWDGMYRASDDEYVDDSTVTMTLTDTDDVPVSSAVDLAMAFVSGSNGQYQGVLPASLNWADDIPVGSGYHLVITATGTQHARRTLNVTVSERTS